jgi:hypothetical protein
MKNSMLSKILAFVLAFTFVAKVADMAEKPEYTVVAFIVLLIAAQFTNVAALKNTLMAGVLNVGDLTFNGTEIKELKEAIYTAVFEKPDLKQFHTIVSGIKAKKQIAILGTLGLVGKKITGCSTTANTGQIGMSEKFWEPQYVGDRFEQCFSDLLESFFVWGLNNGVKKPDLTGTDFANFLEDRLGDAILEMIYRIAWFSDEDADEVENDGTLTNGTDTDYFTSGNGFWKQLFAIAVTTPARRVTIDINAEGAYEDQVFAEAAPDSQPVTKIFAAMKYAADMRLRNSGNLVIVCTQSMADQYEQERLAKNLDAAYDRVENGIDTLKYAGITIIPMNFWDRTIQAYFNDGSSYHLPHRAVLTTAANLQIGTEEEGNLSELNPFYDQKSKTYNVDFGFNLDAKVIEDHMVVVAY